MFVDTNFQSSVLDEYFADGFYPNEDLEKLLQVFESLTDFVIKGKGFHYFCSFYQFVNTTETCLHWKPL